MSLEFVCKYVDAVELSKANDPAGLFESFCDVVSSQRGSQVDVKL